MPTHSVQHLETPVLRQLGIASFLGCSYCLALKICILQIIIHSNYSSDPDHYNYERPTDQKVNENDVKNPINVLLDVSLYYCIYEEA